jgi:hypothetical protein
MISLSIRTLESAALLARRCSTVDEPQVPIAWPITFALRENE